VVCEPVSANFGVEEELEGVFCEAQDYRPEITCYGHSAWDSRLIYNLLFTEVHARHNVLKDFTDELFSMKVIPFVNVNWPEIRVVDLNLLFHGEYPRVKDVEHFGHLEFLVYSVSLLEVFDRHGSKENIAPDIIFP
jgi:hypothetical protein